MRAVTGGDFERVRQMLNEGMNPDFSLGAGETTLHCAVDSEIDWTEANPVSPAESMVPLLLAAGVDPNAMDRYGATALDWTIGQGGPLHATAYEQLRQAGGLRGAEIRGRRVVERLIRGEFHQAGEAAEKRQGDGEINHEETYP